MKIKVYDFDKTIYDGDSTVDFYKYCLKENKRLIKYSPMQLWFFGIYVLGFIDKTRFKEKFYMFLRGIKDIDYTVKGFWNKNKDKIKNFYEKKDHSLDVIISASPEFLLEPICKKLNIYMLIASKVDKNTGKYDGQNCYGEEKVKRLNEKISDYEILEFYSDSYSDAPLAQLTKESYIVDNNNIIKWNEYKMSLYKKLKNEFLSVKFLAFLIIGVINTINGVLFSWLFSLKLDANLAFIVGYVCSLTIAYLLNTFMIFKEKLGFIKFIKFCISYIPNFIIQNVIVIVIYNMLEMNKLIAYTLAAIIGIPITFLCVKLFAFNGKEKTI